MWIGGNSEEWRAYVFQDLGPVESQYINYYIVELKITVWYGENVLRQNKKRWGSPGECWALGGLKN